MDKQYAVRVFDEETNDLERAHVGTWLECRQHAYDLIKATYPDVLVGMPRWVEKHGFHMQGDEYKPGYVGYNHPSHIKRLPRNLLWIVISDANPPPPVKREPFDYDGAIRESAQLMLAEIIKPENADLMEAVKGVGNGNGPGGNFMFGFTYRDLESKWVSAGKDAEEYRKDAIAHNEHEGTLDKAQTERWDAIVEIGDKHGHSGASYGFACRQLQSLLAEMAQ